MISTYVTKKKNKEKAACNYMHTPMNITLYCTEDENKKTTTS